MGGGLSARRLRSIGESTQGGTPHAPRWKSGCGNDNRPRAQGQICDQMLLLDSEDPHKPPRATSTRKRRLQGWPQTTQPSRHTKKRKTNKRRNQPSTGGTTYHIALTSLRSVSTNPRQPSHSEPPCHPITPEIPRPAALKIVCNRAESACNLQLARPASSLR